MEVNVLEIPEVAALYERMRLVQEWVEKAPQPEPAFLGLSHAKMRRAAARIRTGKYIPKDMGDLTPEQIADAMERTIAWEIVTKWARKEFAAIQLQLEALQGAAATRAMDGAVNIFFAGKQLAKERGPDSDIAKSLEVMKRSWRNDFPRKKKKKRAKGKGGDSVKRDDARSVAIP